MQLDGRIRSIEKSSDLIGIQAHNLPACSIVPQPTMLPCAACNDLSKSKFDSGGN
jgi:hypothetical protein